MTESTTNRRRQRVVDVLLVCNCLALIIVAGWLVLKNNQYVYQPEPPWQNPITGDEVAFAEPRLSVESFRPYRALPEPKEPITDFPVISANEVSDEVHDNEIVLGVVVGGEARAYPINVLTGPQREIINEQLGGRAIAATW